jgi:hypothetical protein
MACKKQRDRVMTCNKFAANDSMQYANAHGTVAVVDTRPMAILKKRVQPDTLQ